MVLSAALWLAFHLRFDWDLPTQMFKRLMFVWPYVLGVQYFLLVAFGITNFSWRYVSLKEVRTMMAAMGTGMIIFLGVREFALWLMPTYGAIQYALIPGSIAVLDSAFAFFGIAGIRMLRRTLGEGLGGKSKEQREAAVPTILIGAGEAGVMVAKEISARPELNILPVGFVDDDPVKQGMRIYGIRVLGTTDQIANIREKHHIERALITIAMAPRKDIRRIAMLCKEAGLETRIIPGLYEIVGDRVNLSRIRLVSLEDLLGREPVMLDEIAISEVVRGASVMVTGAGGSIGSELCRQVCRYGPTKLILVEQAENNLFQIHRELVSGGTQIPLIPCLADICDQKRMETVFSQYEPKVVFHAAAHKHVPMIEWNPGEAIKNNIMGTKLIADLSHQTGVQHFVMISTDKAVNPTSVMGGTKRVAELYTQALSEQSSTRFVTVRFGNVLGSAGSVIPIFKEQIERGGPVTVTHPDMRRYFMTIPEACQLVLQAASMGKGGEIFILDMGEPVYIVDMAQDLIHLSGLKPMEDIDIVFTGMRPGEKLFEEISIDEEQATKTRHPKIYVGKSPSRDVCAITEELVKLERFANCDDLTEIRSQLHTLVPEFQSSDAERKDTSPPLCEDRQIGPKSK